MDTSTSPNGIKRIRTAKGITQAELAALTQISQQQIARVERYGYGLGRDGWKKIADALDCNVWELHIPIEIPPLEKKLENFA